MLIQEIGGDSGISEEEESDEEFEQEEKSSNLEEEKSSKFGDQVSKPKAKPLKDGKFHPRLVLFYLFFLFLSNFDGSKI